MCRLKVIQENNTDINIKHIIVIYLFTINTSYFN